MSRIPVTVLGGYLGAGKTTVINHLLSSISEQVPQRRIAILVNDFGPINIDAALIRSRTETVIELTNGCICCSLIDGFASALDGLNQRSIASPEEAPDCLVIETSGVAIPSTVAQYAHMPGFRLDAVIVVVDSEQLHSQLEDRYVAETIRSQIRSADLVLATKSDLVSKQQRQHVVDLVLEIDEAPLLPISDGQVAIEALLGSVGGSPPPMTVAEPAAPSTSTSTSLESLAAETTTFDVSDVQSIAELRSFVADLAPEYVRVKGLIRIGPDLLQVDRVGHRTTVTKSKVALSEPSSASEVHTKQLIAISLLDRP